jgi:hypothetical protein
MSDTKKHHTPADKFDRPSENLASKNIEHAPWHDEDGRAGRDMSKHRRYHSLFEDLMN